LRGRETGRCSKRRERTSWEEKQRVETEGRIEEAERGKPQKGNGEMRRAERVSRNEEANRISREEKHRGGSGWRRGWEEEVREGRTGGSGGGKGRSEKQEKGERGRAARGRNKSTERRRLEETHFATSRTYSSADGNDEVNKSEKLRINLSGS